MEPGGGLVDEETRTGEGVEWGWHEGRRQAVTAPGGDRKSAQAQRGRRGGAVVVWREGRRDGDRWTGWVTSIALLTSPTGGYVCAFAGGPGDRARHVDDGRRGAAPVCQHRGEPHDPRPPPLLSLSLSLSLCPLLPPSLSPPGNSPLVSQATPLSLLTATKNRKPWNVILLLRLARKARIIRWGAGIWDNGRAERSPVCNKNEAACVDLD